MNSLTYLSRQFDVLASAKTPPSTPTAERHSFIRKGRTSASTDDLQQGKKRSSTSSFSQPAQTPLSSRSYSSPALFTLARATALSSTPTSSSSHEPDVPSKSYNDLFRRVFLIRVLVIAWGGLRSAWSSLLKLLTGDDPVIVNVTIDKVRNEKSVDDSTTSEPHLPSQSILTVHLPPIGRSHTDPTFPFDATPEPTSPTLQSSSPSAMTVNDSQAEGSSRASTPMLMTRKTPFHLPKTLVLDLDETLIHSTSRPISTSSARSGIFGLGVGGSKGGGHVVEVVLGGRSTLYHVYKRPFADFFLRTVSGWYTLVIFTASMQEYADPVIDWLDAGRGILSHRMFRDSCTQLPNGSYTKDLTLIEPDLSRVCLVDNSPISYRVNEANGIPIEGWTHDPYDEALLDLLPVLDSLRFTSDVRRVLGLRSAGSHFSSPMSS